MQYHALPCNTMLYNAVPCNTMQYHAIPCNTRQYHAIPCYTMQHQASPYETMQLITKPFNIMQCNASLVDNIFHKLCKQIVVKQIPPNGGCEGGGFALLLPLLHSILEMKIWCEGGGGGNICTSFACIAQNSRIEDMV